MMISGLKLESAFRCQCHGSCNKVDTVFLHDPGTVQVRVARGAGGGPGGRQGLTGWAGTVLPADHGHLRGPGPAGGGRSVAH
jgi:hypothetical protein